MSQKTTDTDAASRPATHSTTPEAATPEAGAATFGDLGCLARVLADAFYDDPIFQWLIPSEARRRAGLRRYFEIQLRVLGFAQGNVWSTQDSNAEGRSDRELTGALIATPPGRWHFPLRALMRYGPAFANTFGVNLPRAAAYLRLVEHRHLRVAHHYIAYIGVTPQSQGQGIGGTLLQPTLDRCDTERLPAYIEATTERSAALYERHGFQLIGETRTGTSPPLFLLLRTPTIQETSPR